MVERGRVLPALAERPRKIADGGTVHLELDVVPRRSRAVPRIELDRLLVAAVLGVVAATVAQVDPADEGDVVVGPIRMADHEQLLVMAAVPPDPLVEQHLAAGLVHRLHEMQVLLLAEVRLVGVRPPHEPADVDAARGQVGEDPGDLGARDRPGARRGHHASR